MALMDPGRISIGNLAGVSPTEFIEVWNQAEGLLADRPSSWALYGVAGTCRWLAGGEGCAAHAPVSRSTRSATPELVERELLLARMLVARRPAPEWVAGRPGWVEAVVATLEWAWLGADSPVLEPASVDVPGPGSAG